MIITISGRSGSGKTSVVKNLIKIMGKDNICYLHQDSFYKDQGHIPFEERERLNYDHPNTLELKLFSKHLKELTKEKTIYKPTYDFVSHTRSSKTEEIYPKPIILADGIHVLKKNYLRDIADIKVFVDTDSDISFIRILLRYTKERGRSVESVTNQYIETVKPMQEKYTVPTLQYADFVISDAGFNYKAIHQLADLIKGL